MLDKTMIHEGKFFLKRKHLKSAEHKFGTTQPRQT